MNRKTSTNETELGRELAAPSEQQCFYCGNQFEMDKLTQEHVFAKWLQRMLNLWDRELVLLNRTSIRYRNLKIPACDPCNTVVLSQLENKIARSMPGGADKLRALGHELLFVWLSKIFFGILYAEALLPIDRKDRVKGPIVSAEAIAGFRHLHFLMQAARQTMEFRSLDSSFHTSILVFPVQQHPNLEHRFMYRDDIEYGSIALRLDTVGLIYLSDGGAQEKLAIATMPRLFNHNLHPLQFEELSALMFTKARHFNRNPAHIISAGSGITRILQMPLAGLSSKPIFDEFDRDHYARVLADFTGIPLETISPSDGRIMTWIGEYHNPRSIDVRQQPWP